MKKEQSQRTYERFDRKKDMSFFFNYNFATKMDLLTPRKETLSDKRYPACTKNVSAEGLCFTSFKKLEKGKTVQMEMFLGENKDPIHMEGEVRWSQSCRPGHEDEKEDLYDTGIKLLIIDGQSVPDSIHYDESHHVIWSVVLESILEKVKDIRGL